jgi:acyl transferase domain-containing protein
MNSNEAHYLTDGYNIAVVGMACRFPGAANVDAFWRNLQVGLESIKVLSDEELLAAGVPPSKLNDQHLVKAFPVLENMPMFDAGFFGISPREAEIMDPQHRQFLECAWEALEHAGCDPDAFPGAIGVFAGSGHASYLTYHLLPNRELRESFGEFLLHHTGNDKDVLATRVSYEFDLKGPSINVQTACSTSMVAVHLACQSLLCGECDMAMGGGVSIFLPQDQGYFYRDGEILSPDGHCRAFDAKAQGTLFGNGVGILVLKRLEDAVQNGDSVLAVIRGTAVNNDGATKAGFLAPSVQGQSQVVATALHVANVKPEDISYVEMHGTGTPVGDPIEVAALTQAFRMDTTKRQFCRIGSVKTNIGHLDTAAGAAGLIKTILALYHRQIPASLHFETPNPEIDFASSPFLVNTQLAEWDPGRSPRRAGVNSLGIGGTNAHGILEEPPTLPPSGESRPSQLVLLSARTAQELEQRTADLAKHLRSQPDLKLADVAFTLQTGRKRFQHRRMLVCSSLEDAAAALETADHQRLRTRAAEKKDLPVAFMFSGQGSQYINMGRALYELEPTFRETVNLCAELLHPHLGLDIREILFPPADKVEWAKAQIHQTSITQPAVFTIEYALAELWMDWGLRPEVMIGHSIGEYVAACVAEVFSLEEALALVAARGRLMQEQTPGAMLAVSLSGNALCPYLTEGISLAAINSPDQCVLAGSFEAIEALERRLAGLDIIFSRLQTSHAFHSAMMDPMLQRFAEEFGKIRLQPPRIPFVSNLTGDWITAEQCTDPDYWVQQVRQTVRFSAGLEKLMEGRECLLLEVGPGRTLARLAAQHVAPGEDVIILSSLRHPQEKVDDQQFLLLTLGQAWMAGARIDWAGFYRFESRRRVHLPLYPFTRQRYWMERPQLLSGIQDQENAASRKQTLDDWFYLPAWKQAPLPVRATGGNVRKSCWLLFEDENHWAANFRKQLEVTKAGSGQAMQIISVRAGDAFRKLGERLFLLSPQLPSDYWRLLKELETSGRLPNRIVHFWNVDDPNDNSSRPMADSKNIHSSFYSLLYLAQAIGQLGWSHQIHLEIVSTGLQPLPGQPSLQPAKALLLGPCKVIPREFPNIHCRSVDVEPSTLNSRQRENTIRLLAAELATPAQEATVAYRNGSRWVQRYEPLSLEQFQTRSSSEPQQRSLGLPSSSQPGSSLSIPRTTVALPPAVNPAPNLPMIDGVPALSYLMKQRQSTTAELPPLSEMGSHSLEQRPVPPSLAEAAENRPVEHPLAFRSVIHNGGVYLITGGLGGLGLAVAEHFAKAAQVKLVLLGRTGLPPEEDWADLAESTSADFHVRRGIDQVQSLREMGAQVLVVKADVSKREELSEAIELARQRFGEIHGVVHAAGVLNDSLIQWKSPEEVEKVLAPKLNGTLLLEELLADTRLDFFLLFSSVSDLAGIPGQVDYCAANAFLDAFAHWKIMKDGTRAIAINWPAWKEVGMAAELLAKRQPRRESSNGESSHPILGGSMTENAEERVFTNALSLERFWLLSEHRFQGGEAVIPGTTYLEMARAAAAPDAHGRTMELREVLFISPLEVGPSETRPARLRLRTAERHASEFVVESRLETEWREHSRGSVVWRTPEPRKKLPLSTILERCQLRKKVFDGSRPETREDAYYFLGVRWNCLKWLQIGNNEAVTFMDLPAEFLPDLNHFKLHPAMLDWATTFALHIFEDYESSHWMYIPFSYKRLVMHQPLPSKFYSHATCPDPSNREMPVFNITIMDPDGNVIVEIEEFTMKGIQPASGGPARKANRTSVPLSTKDLGFDPNEAILSAHGLKALDRILNHPGLPQVIVSPEPLDTWLKRARQHGTAATAASAEENPAQSSASRQPRPHIATPCVPPVTALEQGLVDIWETALGIQGIGINDNFFELGGHSLLLTQSVSRMRKLAGVDIPLRKLFSKPTIAEIVAEIEKLGAGQSSNTSSDLVALPRAAFQTELLVEAQDSGEIPTRTRHTGQINKLQTLTD